MKKRILVVDDEPNMRKILQAMLKREGFEVQVASNGREALIEMKVNPVEVIVTDLKMPVMDGLELLYSVRESHPEVPVIFITAHGSIEAAVEALKKGAQDFITKPFDQDELLMVVSKAVKSYEANAKAAPVIPDKNKRHKLIGESREMQKVLDLLEKVADSPSTVLIMGESGTGKEMIARSLHDMSSRHEKPFIKVNCGAIPDTLIESELFGYEKGAFTGAVSSKPGKFELAHTGTVFLDEIGEISKEMQVKLLRVIQEKEFERVGGLKTIKVDIRIIAATNRDLVTESQMGEFRQDLYYRLSVVPIMLPALRERLSDIPLLTEFFITHYRQRLNKKTTGITEEALQALKKYSWPGNIRELENTIERAVLLSDKEILEKEDISLPLELTPSVISDSEKIDLASDKEISLKELVKEKTLALEKDIILQALKETGGNVTRAAKILQISRKSLQNKMKELQLR